MPLTPPSEPGGLWVNVGMGHSPRRDQGTGSTLQAVMGYENKKLQHCVTRFFGLEFYGMHCIERDGVGRAAQYLRGRYIWVPSERS